MALSVVNWDAFTKVVKALLDRFQVSGSVVLVGDDKPESKIVKIPNGRKQEIFEYSLPKTSTALAIKRAWANDRRSTPREGVVFPDGSVLTVMLSARTVPFDGILSPVGQHIAINDQNGEMIGYVEKYSYCFYPNSEEAEKIGYFRYDFHVESMGDGDLGEHTYFHFHRQLDESYRHATGPILDYGEIVSGLEKKLAPQSRAERLTTNFKKGDFEILLIDLTLQGIMDLRGTLFHAPEWKSFKHRLKYQKFMDSYLA